MKEVYHDVQKERGLFLKLLVERTIVYRKLKRTQTRNKTGISSPERFTQESVRSLIGFPLGDFVTRAKRDLRPSLDSFLVYPEGRPGTLCCSQPLRGS